MITGHERRTKCILLACATLGLVHLFWSVLLITHAPSEQAAKSTCVSTCDAQQQPSFELPISADHAGSLCPNHGHAIDLLILVHSSIEHNGHREFIRTYTRLLPYRWKVIFVLGRPLNMTVALHVQQEQFKFGDILQGDFLDTYRNLTRKHLFGLNWATRHCAQVKSLLKVDDDIFVNYYRLARLVGRVLVEPKGPFGNDFLLCYLHRSMQVIRNITSKWHVTKTEFLGEQYPPFCSGWGYLTTIRVVNLWLCEASRRPFFWIDDVYVTGILRQGSCVRTTAINHLFNVDSSLLHQWVRAKRQLGGKWHFLFSNTDNEKTLRTALHRNYIANTRLRGRIK